jgi:hypothetical protein
MDRDTAGHARAQAECVADQEAAAIMPAPGRGQPAADLGYRLAEASAQAATACAASLDAERLQAALLQESRALRQISQETIARSRAARDRARRGRSQREILRDSPFARLLARLGTMPVIEQAKGIIMAQSRCGEAEAFDILRRASQRSNVPVRDLAARIVATTAGTAMPATGPGTQSRTSTPARTRQLRAG